jgi:hypothetical protein
LRMGKSWSEVARRCSAAVFALAVLAAAGGAIGAAASTRAVPAKLVGKWTRTVTLADLKRTGASGVTVGSVCTLTITKSGAAHMPCTNVGAFDGTIVPAGGDRVHINLGLSTPDVYKWRVSGGRLTFTKVKDTVADRTAAMEGVWKRK